MKHPISAVVTLLLAAPAHAAGPAESADKSRYSVFNPTPPGLMREMSTDRPDTTESPRTVDAGHLQVELSLVEYGWDEDDGTTTRSLAALPANLKLGLLNNLDLQFLFTPYEWTETETSGNSDSLDGFGDDTQFRLKLNFWGNDGSDPICGETAFAFMPFVKLPTGSGGLSNDHVEGGLIFPFAAELPGGWGLGLMAEVDFVYDEDADRYGLDFIHTATLAHDVPIINGLGFYVEYVGIAPHETGTAYQAAASGGFTFAVTENWMIDLGGTIGLSDSAEDFTLFLGTSFRY